MDEHILQELTDTAKPLIMAGLDQEAESMVAEFNRLLQQVIEGVYRTPSEHNATLARQAGEELIRQVADLPPQERSDFIADKVFNIRVNEASKQAWQVVMQWLSNPEESLRIQARDILSQAKHLSDELEQKYPPAVRSRYGRVLSEAILDCEYVLGATDKVSLRLGRALGATQKQPQAQPPTTVPAQQERANALIAEANTLQAAGQYEEAIQVYKEAISLVPAYHSFYLVVGDLLQKLERHQEAAEAYRKVIDDNPNHSQAWGGLGVCMMVLGRHEQAAQALDRAVQLDPQDGQSFFYGAMIYTLQGNRRKAKSYLERALKIYPDWTVRAKQDPLLREYFK